MGARICSFIITSRRLQTFWSASYCSLKLSCWACLSMWYLNSYTLLPHDARYSLEKYTEFVSFFDYTACTLIKMCMTTERRELTQTHPNYVFCAFSRPDKKVVCKKCGQEVSIGELFRDKAVERDLKRESFPCIHRGCSWRGSHADYRVSQVQY